MTSWTVVGAVAGGAVAVHGLDQVQSGMRQAWTGEHVDSFTAGGLQALGMSQGTANLVDAGISVVGSIGAGGATAAIKVARIAATDPLAEGMTAWRIMNRWEKGSRALLDEDFAGLGNELTDPLAKANMMDAGVDVFGQSYQTTTTLLQRAGKSLSLIRTGLTPWGDLGAGAIGSAGGISHAIESFGLK